MNSSVIVVQSSADLASVIREAAEGATLRLEAGAYTGHFSIDKSLTLRGVDGKPSTVLAGDGRSSVVDIIGDGHRVILENLTIADGANMAGGGVSIQGPNYVEIRNCIIRDNTAAYYGGGGIYAAAGELVVRDTRIEGNTGRHGGGVLLDRLVKATFENTTFVGNRARRGGGMRVKEGAVVECRDCVFTDNDLEPGGRGAAIYIAGTMTRKPKLTLLGCRLDGFYRLSPLVNGTAYPGEVLISRSTLPAAMEKAEYFADGGGNRFVPWSEPEPEVYEPTPEEFLLLLSSFHPDMVVGLEDVLTGRSPEEMEQAMTQALDVLIRRGYMTSSPQGETVPVPRLRAWLSACAYPNVALAFTSVGDAGEVQAYFYYVPEFVVANVRAGDGRYSLKRVSQEDVEAFLEEHLPGRGKPASPGETVAVESGTMERIQPLVRSGDVEAVARVLEEAGVSADALSSLAEAIARPVALSTLVLIGFGWPRVEKAVQVLETSEGVWLLRSDGGNDRHSFIPMTGKAALRTILSLADEAHSMVTRHILSGEFE